MDWVIHLEEGDSIWFTVKARILGSTEKVNIGVEYSEKTNNRLQIKVESRYPRNRTILIDGRISRQK